MTIHVYLGCVLVYASVFRCAGKRLHSALLEDQLGNIVDRFMEECLHHSKLRHPNIVQLIGVHYTHPNDLVPTIIMEYLPMSLAQCLDCYPQLPSHMECSILLDVATGLQHLHNQNPPLLHRDLTPNNVLLTSHMQAKITDFGQSKILDLSLSYKQTTAPGNVCYMAPEALVTKPEYTTKIDVFSFGVLVIHVVTHEWPFKQIYLDPKSNQTLPLLEVEKRKVYIDKMNRDSALKVLAVHCLDNNPKKRPDATKLVTDLCACSSPAPYSNTLEMELALEKELAQAKVLKSHIQEVDIHTRAIADEFNWCLSAESSCDFPIVPNESTVAEVCIRLQEISTANVSILDGIGSPNLIVGYKSPINNKSKHNLSVSLMQASSTSVAGGSMDVIVCAPLTLHFTGTHVRSIEGIKAPWGLAAGNSGKIFITDSGGSKGVLLYGRAGELCGEYVDSLYKYDTESVEGKCYYPRGITVDGSCFILADTWCHRIQCFKLTPDLNEAVFLKSAGSKGDGDDQFNVPLAVQINKQNGDVYVCDTDNHRIQVLDQQLKFRYSFGTNGCGPCNFKKPQDIDFDSKGNIYVADCGNFAVKVFNPKWEYQGMIGGEGHSKGTFEYLTSICIDKHDYLYATNKRWNCIQVFNPRREFMMQIKLPPGVRSSEPRGIAVDEMGFVYVSCSATGHVLVYK